MRGGGRPGAVRPICAACHSSGTRTKLDSCSGRKKDLAGCEGRVGRTGQAVWGVWSGKGRGGVRTSSGGGAAGSARARTRPPRREGSLARRRRRRKRAESRGRGPGRGGADSGRGGAGGEAAGRRRAATNCIVAVLTSAAPSRSGTAASCGFGGSVGEKEAARRPPTALLGDEVRLLQSCCRGGDRRALV